MMSWPWRWMAGVLSPNRKYDLLVVPESPMLFADRRTCVTCEAIACVGMH
jgi:hypothetical protein